MSTSGRGARKTTPAKCRACNRPMSSPLFCSDCHTLHAPEGIDYFELFGLEPAYDLDEADLRRRYLNNSREIHPDRHGAGGEEATLSLRGSAWLNEGYRVLADPVLRAEYLLETFGGKSSAEDKAVAPGVLAQTLALREEIEEAQAGGDQAAVSRCRERVQQLDQEARQSVGELARRMPGTEATRHELRQALNGVKYYRKLLELF